jgi:glycosyltransferase involved in cell wall biosynthesis
MIPRYSLVVPLYNEAGNLLPLLTTAFEALAAQADALEVILVDDGSTDTTPADIHAAILRWPQIRGLRHPRNFGQATALLTGLQAAHGDIILTMDGDGQNDPHDFPRLLPLVESGAFDLVCGWRVDRHDAWLRRAMSRLGNVVRRLVLGDHLHDGGCQLRVMRRAVVSCLFPVDLMQSFLPSIVAAAGYRVTELPVRHHPRIHGQAHFGLRQLWWKPAAAMFKVRRRLRAVKPPR